MGDFNIHVDRAYDNSDSQSQTQALKFLQLLDRANLVQHVNESTHDKGHTLDLVITRENDSTTISNLECTQAVSSDHFAIIFDISVPKPMRPKKEITIRKWKNLDPEKFKREIQ